MTMIETENESLKAFAADPQRFLDRLHGSPQPLRVKGDDQKEFVVLNAESFDQMIRKLDELEEVAAIRDGLADLAAGRHRPMREFMAEVAAKFNFPQSNG